MIEIERRFKIANPAFILQSLAALGVRANKTQHIIDQWYIPRNIYDRAGHDAWFDNEHGLAYRIRRNEEPEGAWKVALESKQLTVANDHNTFKEEVVMSGEEAPMQDFLHEQGYYNWLILDKQRQFFSAPSPHLEVIMDTVGGIKEALGINTVLEIEYSGDRSRTQALTTIDAFAQRLGLSPNDLFAKSLTVEAMSVLARFE